MRFFTRYAFPALFLLATSVGVAQGQHPKLADVMSELANELAKVVKIHSPARPATVAIGGFLSPPHLHARGGPGIADLLIRGFPKEIQVNRDAEISISGQYFESKYKDGRLKVIVRGNVCDPKGKVLSEFNKEAFLDLEVAAALMAPTVELPPQDTGEARQTALVQSTTPKLKSIVLDDSRTIVRPAAASKYAISILKLDGQQYVPVEITDKEGEAHVILNQKDVYQIRLINEDRQYAAAARITIDGVSVFALSDEPFEHWFVPKASRNDVHGWYVDKNSSKQFTIAPENMGVFRMFAGSEPDNVGVITVAFSAAWPEKHAPPQDEERLATRGATDGNATGAGALQPEALEIVKANVGKVRTVISVRYSR